MKKNYIAAVIIVAVIGSGCSSTEYVPTSLREPMRKGVYHKVGKGETLWRIAKAYDVSIADITRSNNIPNAAHLEQNQLVFIPGGSERKIIVQEVKNLNANEDLNKEEFIWPVKGRLLFYYGQDRTGQRNNGIGIRANPGAVVQASREGRVIFADYLMGYSHTVVIDHEDTYYTVYSRNADILVKNGDFVYKGDSIARVGEIGQKSYAHFEIRKNAKAENPLYYLP